MNGARLAAVALGLATAAAAALASAPPGDDGAITVSDELAPLARELLRAIGSMSDYSTDIAPPPIFQLPRHMLEARVCETPCSVMAAYVPRIGVYLAANLDPAREVSDRAALLHELVHHLQQDHSKFSAMPSCAREREKEREAVALQNAYLASLGSAERARFNDDFDCGEQARVGD